MGLGMRERKHQGNFPVGVSRNKCWTHPQGGQAKGQRSKDSITGEV